MNIRNDYSFEDRSEIDFSMLHLKLAGIVLSLALALVFSTAVVVSAVEAPEGEVQAMQEEEKSILEEFNILDSESDGFVYNGGGRIDPFMPFEQVIYMGTEEELTGMRKFEPGQLSLVAIVLEKGNNFAMVEDSSGKGYIIRKGIKIGRSGEVEDISANKVVIKEIALTLTGEKQIKTVEMLLRKEGER